MPAPVTIPWQLFHPPTFASARYNVWHLDVIRAEIEARCSVPIDQGAAVWHAPTSCYWPAMAGESCVACLRRAARLTRRRGRR